MHRWSTPTCPNWPFWALSTATAWRGPCAWYVGRAGFEWHVHICMCVLTPSTPPGPHTGHLGGAVRGFRQRRTDRHRHISLGRGGQVAAAVGCVACCADRRVDPFAICHGLSHGRIHKHTTQNSSKKASSSSCPTGTMARGPSTAARASSGSCSSPTTCRRLLVCTCLDICAYGRRMEWNGMETCDQ